MAITTTRTDSNTVPSMGGTGGYVLQSGVARISDGERVRFEVEEITSSVIKSWWIGGDGSRVDVGCDVPADARYDYDATIAFWVDTAAGWTSTPQPDTNVAIAA